MIFVTSGTCVGFERLFQRINHLALDFKDEEIIAQIGQTVFEPKNCTYFRYAPNLEQYYSDARLIISHGGFSTLEIIKAQKPLIIVPRQKQYKEHFDDHQVEFAELLQERFNIKTCINITELTSDLVSDYNYIANFNNSNLLNFRNNILKIL